MGAAGSQGTGLMPPGAASDDDTDKSTKPPGIPMAGFQPDDDDDDDADDQGAGTAPPAGDQQQEIDPGLIDGAPPADDVDDDDDGTGGGTGEGQDFAAAVAAMEDRMQKRFDKAVSKAVRNAMRKTGATGGSSAPPDDGDDDDDETGDGQGQGQPPKPRGRRPAQAVGASDIRTIRLLVKDQIDEALEGKGKAERRAVRDIVDEIVPLIDWQAVDDEDEVVESLIGTVTEKVELLVRTGSDRKVKQLRGLGLIPEAPNGQAGGHAGGQRRQQPVAADMQKGAQRAAARWPKGRRRMGG